MNRVAAAEVRDLGAAAAEQPAVWREVRRFDPPAQAALLAAHRVLAGVADPAKLALVAGDHVEIDRNGARERLYLDQSVPVAPVVQAAPAAAVIKEVKP